MNGKFEREQMLFIDIAILPTQRSVTAVKTSRNGFVVLCINNNTYREQHSSYVVGKNGQSSYLVPISWQTSFHSLHMLACLIMYYYNFTTYIFMFTPFIIDNGTRKYRMSLVSCNELKILGVHCMLFPFSNKSHLHGI